MRADWPLRRGPPPAAPGACLRPDGGLPAPSPGAGSRPGYAGANCEHTDGSPLSNPARQAARRSSGVPWWLAFP